MKYGLVVIHDPQCLYQFIWYYLAYGGDTEWTALCLPNEFKSEYMSNFCQKSGVFTNVVRTDDKSYKAFGRKKQIQLGLQMMLYYLIGKRNLFCHKLIDQYIDSNQYDKYVVICETGIITGACIALGGEKEVVIFDDGIGEYTINKKWSNIWGRYENKWQAFFLSFMGYSGPLRKFPLKTLKNCTKFFRRPDLYTGSEYADIKKMFDEEVLPLSECNKIVHNIYNSINDNMFDSVEAVLFVGDYSLYTSKHREYFEKLSGYISANYKKIAIKLHPKDIKNYSFGNTEVVDIDRSIPSEILAPQLVGKKVLFFNPTTTMMSCDKSEVDFLVFEKLLDGTDCDVAEFFNEKWEEMIKLFLPEIKTIIIK